MSNDFAEFLKKADKHCRTKQDLIDMANKEILKKNGRIMKPPALFRQQLYLKRLEGTEFAAKTGQFISEELSIHPFEYVAGEGHDNLSSNWPRIRNSERKSRTYHKLFYKNNSDHGSRNI